jgi:hypothetical protein
MDNEIEHAYIEIFFHKVGGASLHLLVSICTSRHMAQHKATQRVSCISFAVREGAVISEFLYSRVPTYERELRAQQLQLLRESYS